MKSLFKRENFFKISQEMKTAEKNFKEEAA